MSRDASGQASLELLAGVGLLITAGLIAMQLMAVAYTLHLADGAAEAGALAVAAGLDPAPAARAAMPGWAADRIDVTVNAGRVVISARPPAPTQAIADAVAVRASAWAGGSSD